MSDDLTHVSYKQLTLTTKSTVYNTLIPHK